MILRLGVLVTSVALALSSAALARTWTDSQGNKINAKFVRLHGDSVVLAQGRRVITVPVANLIAEDQEYARQQAEGKGSGSTLPGVSSRGGSRGPGLRQLGSGSTSEPDGEEESAVDDPFQSAEAHDAGDGTGAAASTVGEEPMRPWTDVRGNRLTAQFVAVSGNNVILRSDGGENSYPFSGFSRADQGYVRSVLQNRGEAHLIPQGGGIGPGMPRGGMGSGMQLGGMGPGMPPGASSPYGAPTGPPEYPGGMPGGAEGMGAPLEGSSQYGGGEPAPEDYAEEMAEAMAAEMEEPAEAYGEEESEPGQYAGGFPAQHGSGSGYPGSSESSYGENAGYQEEPGPSPSGHSSPGPGSFPGGRGPMGGGRPPGYGASESGGGDEENDSGYGGGIPGGGFPGMPGFQEQVVYHCSNCNKEVPTSIGAGDRCPHCNVFFDEKRGPDGTVTKAKWSPGGIGAVGGAIIFFVLAFLKMLARR